ncbi:MAG: maltose ABC transporter substrate-binding protein, partial [Oscillospiraceae bacterium]|nr:maltose ABC transporter substrate-binding protein [Oscillospiraceae bacterium]
SNRGGAGCPAGPEGGGIAAVLAQSVFSHLPRVGGNIWDPVSEFATSMALGNPSGASLQTQLDRMVEGVTAR